MSGMRGFGDLSRKVCRRGNGRSMKCYDRTYGALEPIAKRNCKPSTPKCPRGAYTVEWALKGHDGGLGKGGAVALGLGAIALASFL